MIDLKHEAERRNVEDRIRLLSEAEDFVLLAMHGTRWTNLTREILGHIEAAKRTLHNGGIGHGAV